jgi:murein DD-endopeptidase MepM/ murein hydrolase activator NlpD
MPTDVAPIVTVGRWFDEHEAQGRTNIFVRLLDAEGKLAVGVPVTQFWSSGSATRQTERKADPWLAAQGLGADYSLDWPMYEVAPSYGIRIEGDYRGDVVNGCGLGSIEQPDYKIHTAYFFEWQLSSAGVTAPIPPTPIQGGDLTHPLPGAVITQHWGQNEAEYARFGLWGHNGTDLGNRPIRTPIRSMAGGIVAYSDFDVAYGHYVRADYRELDCYAMYCHLDEPGAPGGTRLAAGDTVGLLGTSGNSTGVHLHLEIRLQNKDGTYREDTPMPKGRVDPETWAAMHNLKL